MKIKEVAKRMGSFLNDNGHDGTIVFDHKSYDDENDIPHIFENGKRRNVLEMSISPNGDFIGLFLTPSKGCVGMDITTNENIAEIDEEELEKELAEMGIYELLQDAYYETNESYDVGDFEMDFLKEY